jgi:hypothetical protein
MLEVFAYVTLLGAISPSVLNESRPHPVLPPTANDRQSIPAEQHLVRNSPESKPVQSQACAPEPRRMVFKWSDLVLFMTYQCSPKYRCPEGVLKEVIYDDIGDDVTRYDDLCSKKAAEEKHQLRKEMKTSFLEFSQRFAQCDPTAADPQPRDKGSISKARSRILKTLTDASHRQCPERRSFRLWYCRLLIKENRKKDAMRFLEEFRELELKSDKKRFDELENEVNRFIEPIWRLVDPHWDQ